MPYSKKQKRAAGADLDRKRHGKKLRTFPQKTSEKQLADMASGPIKKKKKTSKKRS